MTTVLWYRQDLRTSDHDALLEACARGAVVPVYVWNPAGEGGWPMGGAQQWWLDRSLRALAADLESRGSRLVVRSGDPAVELAAVAKEPAQDLLWWPSAIRLSRAGGVKEFNQNLIGLRS
jgi:deoxyribodipyrimidine photo-lyase